MSTAMIPTNQAAERIGVKPHTLRVWRGKGKGPAYHRLGGPRGRCVYAADELERWLEARRFNSTTEEMVAAASEGR